MISRESSEEFQEQDPRMEELDSLCAIFPEAEISHEDFSGSVEIPVVLDKPIEVTFDGGDKIKKSTIKALPSVLFNFTLPDSYPTDTAPEFNIIATWLSPIQITRINEVLNKLWEEFPDFVIYSMIDSLQVEVLKYLESLEGSLKVDNDEDFKSLSSFDESSKLSEFNQTTFTCEICQDDKKGLLCRRLPVCDHVFCLECLESFFKEAIQTGDLEKIHCPNYDCTKKYVSDLSSLMSTFSSTTVFSKSLEIQLFELPLSKEFLNTVVDDEAVQRFTDLFTAQRFETLQREFPLRVVQCPRPSCNKTFINENTDESLAICPSCKFAFCRECRRSWHGTTNYCKPVTQQRISLEEIETWLTSAEDSAERNELSLKYGKKSMIIAVNTFEAEKAMRELVLDKDSDIQICPYCKMFIERSDGCNKMRCTSCNTQFCNLCGDYLSPNDPYIHFSTFESPCYGKLFDGMIQDENNGNEGNIIM